MNNNVKKFCSIGGNSILIVLASAGIVGSLVLDAFIARLDPMSRTNNAYRNVLPAGVPYSGMSKDLSEKLFDENSLSGLMVDVIKDRIQAIRNAGQPSPIRRNSNKNSKYPDGY